MNFKQIVHRFNQRNTHLFLKKITFTKIIFIFLIIFTSTFSIKAILAQTNPNTVSEANSETLDFNPEYLEALKKGMNQESWLDSGMDNNLNAIYLKLGGVSTFKKDGGELTYVPQGAIGTVNRMVGSLFNQPISGIEYIAQVKNDFLGKSAYAQNTGFVGLQPILPAWRACRNIVYSLFSLIFITVGIMIMLRIKISPQAVITIQNSIPKIITSLILVTFSYAIAGLVVDFSKLVVPIGVNLVAQVKPGLTGDNPAIFPTYRAPFSLDPALFGGFTRWFIDLWKEEDFSAEKLSNPTFSTIYKLTRNAIPDETGQLLGKVAGTIFFGVISGDINSLGTAVGSWATERISKNILFPVIIAIFIFIWLIKLYFGLLKCYITLIFNIIVAPFQIAVGAFPTSKSGFSKWILNVVANISVFPIVTLFLIFINFLCELLNKPDSRLWIPSQISMADLTNQNNSIVAAGIALAGLAMLSKLPTLITQAVFQIKASPFGKAIGEAYALRSIPGYKTVSGGLVREAEDRIGKATYGIKDRTMGKVNTYFANRRANKNNNPSEPIPDSPATPNPLGSRSESGGGPRSAT